MPFYAMKATFAQVYIGFSIQICTFDFTGTPAAHDALWSTVINQMKVCAISCIQFLRKRKQCRYRFLIIAFLSTTVTKHDNESTCMLLSELYLTNYCHENV